jgi:NTE family protein
VVIETESRAPAASQRVGLALGSGSSRGWAHIGVIQALADADIHVDYVAGTSIGALVGAAFASNKIDVLRDFVLGLDWKQVALFLDVVWPRSGLIDGQRVTDFFHTHVRKSIEDLPIPFAAVATDLATGGHVIMREGDVVEAIRASISVPGVFTPVTRNGMTLVDGGLVDPVPVRVVREMGATFVIAVDLNHDTVARKGVDVSPTTKPSARTSGPVGAMGSMASNTMLDSLRRRIASPHSLAQAQISRWVARSPLPNIFEILLASSNIMQAQISASQLRMDPPDVLIQPQLGHFKFLDFNRGQEAIDEGYREAAEQIISAIR